MDPFVMILILAILVVMGRKPRDPSAGAAAILLLSLAVPARAAESEAPDPFRYRIDSWTVAQLAGEAKGPVFGASAEAVLTLGRVTLATWYRASAMRNGVDLDNPETFDSLEVYALGAFEVRGPFALAAVSGYTRPSVGEDGPVQRTWLVGALVGDRHRWILVGLGRHEVAGDGLRLMSTAMVRIEDRTSLVGDLVAHVDGGRIVWGQVRAGVAVQIWGDR